MRVLVLGAVTALLMAGAADARAPRYSGTITVSAAESSPGGGGRSAYAYDGKATLPFAFGGTGQLGQTRQLTVPLIGHYETRHGTSDYRLCKGQDESGELSGLVRFYLWPKVSARTVAFSFAEVGESMTPNWRTVCGLPQAQAGGFPSNGLLGQSISAAAGKSLTFTFPARGGTLKRSGALPSLPGSDTRRTYTVTVVLTKTG